MTQVPEDEVARLQAGLKPGKTLPSTEVYERYERIAQLAGHEPAARVALGRALTAAGWKRDVVRKSRGPRGAQKIQEISVWIVPGAVPIPEEDNRVGGVLRALLGDKDQDWIGDHRVWDGYQSAAWENRWLWSMSLAQLNEWLNRKGFPHRTIGGKRGRNGWAGLPSRYVDRAKVDRIDPPDVEAEMPAPNIG